jgi:hypothetical protein
LLVLLPGLALLLPLELGAEHAAAEAEEALLAVGVAFV